MAKSRPGGVPPAPINHASRHDAPAEPSRLLWYLGLIALAISVLSSLLLVLDHFGGLQLPGCGKGSECAAAANSVWGKIPIGRNFAWPVSFLGFAYFFGAAVAWLASSSGVAPLFRHVARFGAAVSVFFLVIIVAGSFHCKYCLASHAGNLAFWIIMELTRRGPVGPLRPVGALVGLFVAASAVLLGVEVATRSKVQVAQEKQLQDSIANITASDSRKASAADPPPAANQQGSQTPTVAAKPSGAAPASAPTQAAVQPPTVGPEPVQPPRPVTNEPEFTGRYRVGPARPRSES